MGQPYIDFHKENAKVHRHIAFLLDVRKKQATEIFELEQRLEAYKAGYDALLQGLATSIGKYPLS